MFRMSVVPLREEPTMKVGASILIDVPKAGSVSPAKSQLRAALRHQDIGWLQIPMHDPFCDAQRRLASAI